MVNIVGVWNDKLEIIGNSKDMQLAIMKLMKSLEGYAAY
jgi:hypothetical protein